MREIHANYVQSVKKYTILKPQSKLLTDIDSCTAKLAEFLNIVDIRP